MNKRSGSFVTRSLETASPTVFSVYCIVAAFGTYFCMYAFRKPFTAGTFDGVEFSGIAFKTVLIATQVAGYTISKFIGIKVVSEMSARYRAVSILGLIAIAEIALFLFAITPVPWNFIWLFVNGLPLGMVFGLVLGFLEGRKVTEALSAGLCASFILASGVVVSVGQYLIQSWNISEYWMPVTTGLIFALPLLVSVWMLSKIPPPNFADESLRSIRQTMNGTERIRFFRKHAFGLVSLIVIYVLLTIARSVRSDFAVEIWGNLGITETPRIYAISELWVTIGVVAINGSLFVITNNRTAFLTSIGLCLIGFAIAMVAVLAHMFSNISPMFFMILLGLGMYIPYVAFHTTIFERMIAAFRETGTIGYLMYLADAVGYLAYVFVMVFKNVSSGNEINFLDLLIWVSIFVTVISTMIAGVLTVYYYYRIPLDEPTARLATAGKETIVDLR
jgi:hypothetical protein